MPFLASVEYVSWIICMCRKVGSLHHALSLSMYMCKSGLEAHMSLRNCMVWMLLEVGSVCHVQQVVDKLGFWDDYLWNAVIVGYAKSGELQHAYDLYQMIWEDGTLRPTSYTFVALLKSCIKMKDIKRGHKLHTEIAKLGFLETDIFIGSTLVDM
eukprot:c17903_g1_i1 orf=801-1265(+)